MEATNSYFKANHSMEEAELIFAKAKNDLLPSLSIEDKDKQLSLLEQRISGLFSKTPINLDEKHTFEDFSEKFTASYPELKFLFSDLFVQMNSHEDIIDFHLNTMGLDADLESELITLCKKLPDKPEVIALLIDKIDQKFEGCEEKQKLAYKVIVEVFNVNTSQKFKSINRHSNELLAIEAARLHANKESTFIAVSIQNYNIKNLEALIEIAKIAASRSGVMTSKFIKNFGIKEQKVLIEIFKIAMGQKFVGGIASQYIGDYCIEDEKVRIELAKIAVSGENGDFASTWIANYAIKDQEALIEIAKLAATQDGLNISRKIANYAIKDQEALIAIANIAATQNPWTFELINNYGIKQEKVFLFFLNLMISTQGAALELLENQFRADFLPELISAFLILKNEDSDLLKVYDNLSAFCLAQKWDLPKSLLNEMQMLNIRAQKLTLSPLLFFLGQCHLENISPDQFKLFIDYKLLESFIQYPDPLMRYQLINPLVASLNNEKGRDYLVNLLKTKSAPTNKTRNKKQDHPQWARIPLVLITCLHEQGFSKEICNSVYKIACENNFKDVKNRRALVNALHTILDTTLDLNDKENLLLQVNSKNIPNMLAMRAIKDMNKIVLLKMEHLAKKSLSDVLQQSFLELVPIKQITHFDMVFTKYFTNNRIPNFIITYAAKLAADKQSLESLGVGLDGIFAGNYPEMRYDINRSKHLLTIFSERKDLFEQWKKGAKRSLGAVALETKEAVKPIDFFSLFKELLIDWNHLEQSEVPILFQYLESNNFDIALKSIEKQIEPNKDNTILKIEKACILLTEKNLTLPKQKELLKNMKQYLLDVVKEKPQFKDFEKDIKDLFQAIIKLHDTKDKYDNFEIIDTDDYQDLFLSGTEVGGSCQDINGNPMVNKCLMAYVFDGKNRLLAVKDKSGRIIARQIFRILLDRDQPVLFTEHIYPAIIDPVIQNALQAFAIERAKDLKLPLLTRDPSKPKWNSSIESLSTMTPVNYEYTDAGDSHVTTGVYTIDTPNVISL